MNRLGNSGFSVLEIMAVMILLTLLGGTAAVTYNAQVKKGRIRAAKTQIATFDQAISLFELDCGFFPTALDDLIHAPTSRRCKGYPDGGYIKKKEIPQDPWSENYNYDANGSRSGFGYDLWSNGPDKEEGTEDDVTSWDSDSGDSNGDEE